MELKERPFGLIQPSQDLQRRIGGPLRPLDERQIHEVETALEELASGMADWIKTDIDRLVAARNAFMEDSQSPACIRNLHLTAHDLKGLGRTYGFPVVSVIADILCKVIDQSEEKNCLPEDLVNAHVDAMRAVVNLNLRDPDGGPAQELLQGLRQIANLKAS